VTSNVERDEGLANERTALAWWRTALAAVVAAGLIVRGAAGPVQTVIIALVAAPAVGVILIVALQRARALTEQHRGAPALLTTVSVALALLVLQVTALVVVL
jgi:uncharacterized membrane protein YidH (DUF202 family)